MEDFMSGQVPAVTGSVSFDGKDIVLRLRLRDDDSEAMVLGIFRELNFRFEEPYDEVPDDGRVWDAD